MWQRTFTLEESQELDLVGIELAVHAQILDQPLAFGVIDPLVRDDFEPLALEASQCPLFARLHAERAPHAAGATRHHAAEELADEMQIPVSRVRAILKMSQQPVSLHAPVGDSEDASFGEFIEDHASDNPVRTANNGILRGKIEQLLKTLTFREREIIRLRYGLGDGYNYTLEEVGRIFKVTRERVRQIEAKAVKKLQHPVRALHLEGFLKAAS